jgi:hypothetical protein
MFSGIPYMNKSNQKGRPAKKGNSNNNSNSKALVLYRAPARKRPQVQSSSQVVTRGSIPAAYSNAPARRNNNPLVKTMGRTTQVIHSEFFHDVFGTVDGHFIRHAISPSTVGVFPWLSGMAGLYESYRFNNLRFRYETAVGTTTAGTFAMAPDYDSNDAFPSTKGELLTYDDRARSAVYKDCTLVCSKKNLEKRSTYFTGLVPAGKDPNLYNIGNLVFFTGGCPNTSQIGELYVDYDVTFSTPQANKNLYPNGIGGQFGGFSNVAPFGLEQPSSVLTSSGTMTLPSSSGTTVSQTVFTFLKDWRGFVTVNYTGTGLTSISEAVSGGFNAVTIFTEIGFSTQVAGCYACKAPAGSTLILTMGNTTLTDCDITFGQAPNGVA